MDSGSLEAHASDDTERPDSRPGTSYLVLGGPAPARLGGGFHTDSDSPYAGIVLLGAVPGAELARALAAASDPALPVADFAGNAGLRRDFVGTVLDHAAVEEMRRHFTPIWRRLAELPFRAAPEDRAELTLLRLAYSRAGTIEARLSADSPLLVDYPLLGRQPGLRRRLEALAQRDLLRRRHFMRTHGCAKCASARLHAYEACPGCGGAELVDEPLVHHYRCGWQELESRFARGRLLVCPKCRRELRHFGVDYDKPGSVVVCRACGAANADPAPTFICLDCAAVTPAADAADCDWHHYDLTEDGLRALREGRLPRLEIGAFLNGRTRAFPLRDFLLLATEGVRTARRYKRDFALGAVSVANYESLRHAYGPADIDAAFRLMVDVLIGSLRDSDFVGANGAATVLVGFPETGAGPARAALERAKKAIAGSMAVPFEIVVTGVEGEAAAELLALNQSLGG